MVMNPANNITEASLPSPPRPTNIATNTPINAIAKKVPSQGPRLRVNINPKTWTASATPPAAHTANAGSHWDRRLAVARFLSGRLERATTAPAAVIGMVINITAAANMAFPMNDVTRPLAPPPVISIKFRESCP